MQYLFVKSSDAHKNKIKGTGTRSSDFFTDKNNISIASVLGKCLVSVIPKLECQSKEETDESKKN